jgi:hypothetical protein
MDGRKPMTMDRRAGGSSESMPAAGVPVRSAEFLLSQNGLVCLWWEDKKIVRAEAVGRTPDDIQRFYRSLIKEDAGLKTEED